MELQSYSAILGIWVRIRSHRRHPPGKSNRPKAPAESNRGSPGTGRKASSLSPGPKGPLDFPPHTSSGIEQEYPTPSGTTTDKCPGTPLATSGGIRPGYRRDRAPGQVTSSIRGYSVRSHICSAVRRHHRTGSPPLDSSPPSHGPSGGYHSLAAPMRASNYFRFVIQTTVPMATIVIIITKRTKRFNPTELFTASEPPRVAARLQRIGKVE